jgi:hypothetical protein
MSTVTYNKTTIKLEVEGVGTVKAGVSAQFLVDDNKLHFVSVSCEYFAPFELDQATRLRLSEVVGDAVIKDFLERNPEVSLPEGPEA